MGELSEQVRYMSKYGIETFDDLYADRQISTISSAPAIGAAATENSLPTQSGGTAFRLHRHPTLLRYRTLAKIVPL